MSEQDRLLGSEGSGALKLGNTHSALLGYSRHVTLGDADIGFAAHFTFSQAEGDDKSLMRGTKGALASAFGVTMKRGDWHWALKQPTYFEFGELRLNVPVRRLADGGVVFENRTFDMRGAHRPLEVSMMHGDAMAKIGLRIETPNGRDVRAGFGYFKRF